MQGNFFKPRKFTISIPSSSQTLLTCSLKFIVRMGHWQECMLVKTASLVKERLGQDVWKTFLLIKRNRPVAHLNAKMNQALTAWERKYNLKVED